MAGCRLGDGALVLNGQPFELRGAEIPYFALPRPACERQLDLAAAAGCNAASSYMPWFVHEAEEGRFDFAPLVAFLDACAQRGLWVVARPGPWINWSHETGGVPDWV